GGQGASRGGDRLHRWPAPLGGDRGVPRGALRGVQGVRHRGEPPGCGEADVIDHIGFEVAELARSAKFYDAVLYALGVRRMFESEHAIAYGVNGPALWIVVRGRPPGP